MSRLILNTGRFVLRMVDHFLCFNCTFFQIAIFGKHIPIQQSNETISRCVDFCFHAFKSTHFFPKNNYSVPPKKKKKNCRCNIILSSTLRPKYTHSGIFECEMEIVKQYTIRNRPIMCVRVILIYGRRKKILLSCNNVFTFKNKDLVPV